MRCLQAEPASWRCFQGSTVQQMLKLGKFAYAVLCVYTHMHTSTHYKHLPPFLPVDLFVHLFICLLPPCSPVCPSIDVFLRPTINQSVPILLSTQIAANIKIVAYPPKYSPTVHQHTYLFICPVLFYLSPHPLSIYLSESGCLSLYLYLYLSISPFLYSSFSLYLHLSFTISLSLHISIIVSLCLSISLSPSLYHL